MQHMLKRAKIKVGRGAFITSICSTTAVDHMDLSPDDDMKYIPSKTETAVRRLAISKHPFHMHTHTHTEKEREREGDAHARTRTQTRTRAHKDTEREKHAHACMCLHSIWRRKEMERPNRNRRLHGHPKGGSRRCGVTYRAASCMGC